MSEFSTIPESIIRLAESIGWDIALKLVECYPGMRLRIPVKLADTHVLVQQLGKDGAMALVKLCADEEIYIPKAKAHMLAKRNAAIVEEYTLGAKVPDLVRRYGLTDRQIYNVLAKPVIEAQQLSFF